MGHQHHGPTFARGLTQERVEHLTPVGVEPGMRLVKQQETRLACDPHGEREPPALPGRESTVRNVGEWLEPEPIERPVGRVHPGAGRPGREPEVLPHGQIVVAAGLVADERELTAMRPPISGEVVTEHLGLAGVQRYESGQEAQECGLPGSVPPGEQHHLAFGDVEIDVGKSRKAAEETHHRAKADDGLHSASFLFVTLARPILTKRIAVYEAARRSGEPTPAAEQEAGRSVNVPQGIGRRIGVVRRVAGAIGRTFITVGILILLFVAYQLWGTGIYTDREQDQLQQQFNAALRSEGADAPTTTTTLPGTGPTATTTTTAPAPPAAPEGDAVAQIRIPKIGVDSIVVNGVTRDDLRKGPGHYPNTPLPGQEGNSAIAGHRTTYGAPFGDLDQLAPDDLIEVRTLQGSFRYRVTEQLIVAPSDISVIDPVLKNPDDSSQGFAATLTLTTCNPKYSAAQRLIIKAELEPDQVALPAPEASGSPGLTEAGLSGEEGSKLPTLLSGLVLLLVGLLWWLFFHRHPRWTTWIVGAIPFAIALFIFFSYLERVLPANY